MKRILLFLLCNSPLLLNAMTKVKVKQDGLEKIAAQLKEKLLIESVERNDITTVKTLLAEKVNPNFIYTDGNNDGWTLLKEAIYRNNINMIQVFIAAKADVNLRKNAGYYTPLQYAIESNKSNITQLLIHAGANIHAVYKKMTALSLALKLGQASIVQLLIARGAELHNIDTINIDIVPNKLVIIQAIEMGKKERQKLLEEQKAVESQEEKKSEISLTPYSGMYPQLGDDAYHQLSASESAKSKNKAAKKSHCTML